MASAVCSRLWKSCWCSIRRGDRGRIQQEVEQFSREVAAETRSRLLEQPQVPTPNPLALIAEITHRCPLHCVYCSNPLEMQKAAAELSTEEWVRVFREAGQLGVLHLHLTGGEPLARPDLTELIAGARAGGLYVNLITSGIGLSETRLAALVDAGLEHFQLSFQDSREAGANEIAGTRSHAHKLQLAGLIRQFKIAFTVNVVVHRQNLDHLGEIIAMAEELGPDRLEIANVQYYGWALRNRDLLLPTRQQVEQSQAHGCAPRRNGCAGACASTT